MSSTLSSLLDHLREWRDRKLADPKFRASLLANPLTRGFARRRAKAMLDLCAGFVYSQTLLACVELKLLEQLRAGPQTADALAPKLGLEPSAARRLLEAATSLNLASRRRDGRYGLGDLGAALIGTPEALALIAHQPIFYADLADPVALLRGKTQTRLSRYWPYSGDVAPQELNAESVAPYSALMAASNPLWSETALAAYDIGQHRRLLDVGGGEGAFLEAAAARAPELELMLFDLPAVAERAKARLTAAGLAERTQIFSGDFLKDSLPQGADAISLVRIVHDHDDASAIALLRNVRRALSGDGTLLIVEAISDAKGAEALCAYYAFYTLAMGRGEPRRFKEIAALLNAAGFADARLVKTPLPAATSLIVAKAG
ncbi:methyltransferase [Methylocystis bryophila]|uniref:Methyltransferase n=1 Tax=Methylocystis bryophila TaxID=655015 RepID=A0A1W6MRA9_9HYPH|nr:methyltransferase [Methylocystis bryophila]ARN80105.1 methyltransferase [Methylocystis bryophila]BDV40036.1 O-methyltransferase [Methylocystis bryophila]